MFNITKENNDFVKITYRVIHVAKGTRKIVKKTVGNYDQKEEIMTTTARNVHDFIVSEKLMRLSSNYSEADNNKLVEEFATVEMIEEFELKVSQQYVVTDDKEIQKALVYYYVMSGVDLREEGREVIVRRRDSHSDYKIKFTTEDGGRAVCYVDDREMDDWHADYRRVVDSYVENM